MQKFKLKWSKVSTIAMLCLLVFAMPVMYHSAGDLFGAQVAKAETEAVQRTISVSGKGEVQATPDIVYIEFGVQTTAKTAAEAHKENSRIFDQVKKVLEKSKIANKDIQTVRFYTSPDYDYTDKGRNLKGYQVEHILRVATRDLGQLGQLLDELSRAGVNRIDQIQQATEKETNYELQALEKALEQARAKAEVLAKKEGKKIKGILHIAEGGGYPTPVYSSMKMMDMAMAEEASMSTEIFAGELMISKQVQVTYEIE